MIIGEYRPSAVDISLFGVSTELMSDDVFARIEEIDVTSKVKRSMGSSSMIITDSETPYRVTINLSSASGSNLWIHLLYKIYVKYGADFKMPLSIKDKSGDTSFFSSNTYFEGLPPTELGTGLTQSSWSFICFTPSFTKGGNTPPHQIVETLQMLDSVLSAADSFGIDFSNFTTYIENFIATSDLLFEGLFQ